MRRSVLFTCFVVLTVVSLGLSGVAPISMADGGTTADPGTSATGESQSMTSTTQPVSTEQDFDRTTFDITVLENGTAVWTFQYERTLDGEDDVGSFSEFASEFESEETQLYRDFVFQAENLTDSGAEHTDREMSATQFNRSASIEQGISPTGNETGVVEMTFYWEGFATVDEDGTVTAGDVFDGLVLQDDQRLVVEPDDGLEFRSVQSDGEYATESVEDASSVTWRGEIEFIPGEPRMTFEPEDGSNTSPFSNVAGWLSNGVYGPLGLVLFIIAVLAVAGAFVRYWSREARQVSTRPSTSAQTDESESDSQSAISETELLSDEDQVIAMLEENGGRMKQVQIVEETGWSKSKVSMLLSEMESDGAISKLRVGRENIISLEGHEPEATKSPFDE